MEHFKNCQKCKEVFKITNVKFKNLNLCMKCTLDSQFDVHDIPFLKLVVSNNEEEIKNLKKLLLNFVIAYKNKNAKQLKNIFIITTEQYFKDFKK